MNILTVDGHSVQPGERRTFVATVDLGTRRVEVPVIVVNGRADGPRIAVTGGIHGAEYVAIEAARRVGMSIDPDELAGSLVVVPISNTTSYYARAIYTSALDDQNINRVFPGNATGSPSEVLADWLFRTIVAPSDRYIDMHGGDMIEALVPFVLSPRYSDPDLDAAALAMAAATGIPRIIHSDVAGSTAGAAAAAGIPAVLAEIGGQGVWREDEVTAHAESTLRVLRHLGALPGDVPPEPRQRVYDTFAWVRAESGGLFHPAVSVGDTVAEGQRVGAIVDYFGATLQDLHATCDGEVGFLVTSLAMNPGDPILAICA